MRFLFLLLLLSSRLQAQTPREPLAFPHDGIILGEGVKVRSEPSTKGVIITELPFGSYVRVLRQSEQSQQIGQNPLKFFWANVETADGKQGWVYGRYVNAVKPMNKDKCVFNYNGECFYWQQTRCAYTEFVDGDQEIMDNVLHIFRSANDPRVFYPIRNVRALDKALAIEGHWQTRLNCCMIVDGLESYRQVGDVLEITWNEGIEDDFDRKVYTITFQEDHFQLDWGKAVERHYFDLTTNAMQVATY